MPSETCRTRDRLLIIALAMVCEADAAAQSLLMLHGARNRKESPVQQKVGIIKLVAELIFWNKLATIRQQSKRKDMAKKEQCSWKATRVLLLLRHTLP